MGRTLLLTGRPGVGKTTIVRKVANLLGHRAGGFYTEEIRRPGGRREGFRLVTLDGAVDVLAHTSLRGERHPRIGRYGVDVSVIADVGALAIRSAISSNQVVIVDEIGKMELLSKAFREAVRQALKAENPVFGTVMRGSHPWVNDLRASSQVEVWEVTTKNRDDLPRQSLQWLRVDASAE